MLAAARTMQAPTRLICDFKQRRATETLEKDDTELRLERAVFGDNAGFLQSLTRHVAGDDRALLHRGRDKSDESDYGDGADGEDEDLGDVADEDVSPGVVCPSAESTAC